MNRMLRRFWNRLVGSLSGRNRDSDLADELKTLKERDGGDMIVYGGSNFVSNLIKHNLIDEYYLFVNPVAIGQGLSIFGEVGEAFRLENAATIAFDCGITVHKYLPVATSQNAVA